MEAWILSMMEAWEESQVMEAREESAIAKHGEKDRKKEVYRYLASTWFKCPSAKALSTRFLVSARPFYKPARKLNLPRSAKGWRPVVGKSSRGKLRLTLLTQRFRVQTSGEHPIGHASPTTFSCSSFYLVVAPIRAFYVAAPPEAI